MEKLVTSSEPKLFEAEYKIFVGKGSIISGFVEIIAENHEEVKKRLPAVLCRKYGFEKLPEYDCTGIK
jgi:hypothetical protein